MTVFSGSSVQKHIILCLETAILHVSTSRAAQLQHGRAQSGGWVCCGEDDSCVLGRLSTWQVEKCWGNWLLRVTASWLLNIVLITEITTGIGDLSFLHWLGHSYLCKIKKKFKKLSIFFLTCSENSVSDPNCSIHIFSRREKHTVGLINVLLEKTATVDIINYMKNPVIFL